MGRAAGCQITLDDTYASQIHARVFQPRRPVPGRGSGLHQRHLPQPPQGGRSHAGAPRRPPPDRQHRAGVGVTRLSGGAATDVGRVRSTNQDSYFLTDSLYAVADGMGGHRGGEVASELATESLRNEFGQGQPGLTTDELVRAVQRANEAVVTAASNDPDLLGMGTTLCALALIEAEDEAPPGHHQRGRLSGLPAQGRCARADHRRPQPGGHPRTPGPPHRRRGRRAPPAQHHHPGPGHRQPGHGRLLGGAPRRRRPLPAVQRRPVQRGRREPHRRHPAQAGLAPRGRPRARPAGQRGRRPRQHHRDGGRRRGRPGRSGGGVPGPSGRDQPDAAARPRRLLARRSPHRRRPGRVAGHRAPAGAAAGDAPTAPGGSSATPSEPWPGRLVPASPGGCWPSWWPCWPSWA